MIEETAPADWGDLQDRTAQILSECGLEAETNQEISLARGTVKLDVLARDPRATPAALYVCECKHWQSSVPKQVVHAFRSVVVDSGAHVGFLISSAGFQSGAREAAAYSNVRLVTWLEFQDLFAERWFRTHMAPGVVEESAALHEYTMPINTRIAKKAEALPSERRQRFQDLQERYAIASLGLLMLWFDPFSDELAVPVLPLRASLANRSERFGLPSEILDAVALRPLMEAVTRFYRQAASEFDNVFGGRV